MKTRIQVEERIRQHEADLEGWREDGAGGLTSLVPTEPDTEEVVRRELKAAVFALKWVLA